MTIVKEVLRKLFLPGEPIFRMDRRRYAHVREKEFPELSGFTDSSKLQFESASEDQFNMRTDLSNAFYDLKKAFKAYKTEKLPLND